MASRVYEIVELNDGEYILQRSDRDEEPLVRIKFSEEACDFLSEARTGVAKIMIEAGLTEVEDLVEDELTRHTDAEESSERGPQTLH